MPTHRMFSSFGLPSQPLSRIFSKRTPVFLQACLKALRASSIVDLISSSMNPQQTYILQLFSSILVSSEMFQSFINDHWRLLGYAKSEIFANGKDNLKPATMPLTITIPALGRHHAARVTDDSDDTPHPKAYKRAKEFLKTMLRKELDRLKDDPNKVDPLLQEIGAKTAVEEFREQLKAYAYQQWPFNARVDDKTALLWWENLRTSPPARVLAVCDGLSSAMTRYLMSLMFQMLATKIFSVLVNSMPDERTGSKLTWFNSALRSNQDVRTIVDMAQVGEWYGIHEVPISLIFLCLCSSVSCRNARQV
jgi:hypothetical protein